MQRRHERLCCFCCQHTSSSQRSRMPATSANWPFCIAIISCTFEFAMMIDYTPRMQSPARTTCVRREQNLDSGQQRYVNYDMQGQLINEKRNKRTRASQCGSRLDIAQREQHAREQQGLGRTMETQ